MSLTAVRTAEHAPPRAFETRRLLVGATQVAGAIGVLGLVAAFAPGLDRVRGLLGDASAAWLAVAVGLQVLSCLSYVLMFRPIFCPDRSWATAQRIGWSALGVGSIVPASGAAGLALGGWALVQEGVEPERVARRSVAFFLVKGSINFVAVAVLGVVMGLGLVGPPVSPWLTWLPAALAVATIAAVVLLARADAGGSAAGDASAPAGASARAGISAPAIASEPAPMGASAPAAASAEAGMSAPANASRARRWAVTAGGTLVAGSRDALAIVRAGDPRVVAGAVGYWLFDNAVLWAAFKALGADVPLSVILLGYLVGQLGGLLPIPGGVGGIDGGLLGMLLAFGAPAAATAAAVLLYRVILFWIPLLGGAIGFVALKRALAGRPARPQAAVSSRGVPVLAFACAAPAAENRMTPSSTFPKRSASTSTA